MEGAGEGMVAILQGTKHAGLRVTLVPDNRLRCKRKCVLMDLGPRPPTRITHSSVETNTEKVFKNASEPMCDVRYASSYQFTNCKAVQSSFRVSDIPQHSTFYRPSDQFAESLRKYPVQASSEILQRIINYSNIKQNTRKQNVKTIRALLHKSTSQHMNRRYESGVNTNNEIYERIPLNRSIGSRYSSQKELLSYTYDYLKCISLIPRSMDVRYLTQVKRCIRNRLLEIIDDRPAICSRIRSRYSHHQRHFHGPTAKPMFVSNENEIRESNGITKCSHLCCKTPSYSRRKCNFFPQPFKCPCTPSLNKQNPLESLMRKLYPELNVNKKEIPPKKIVQEPEIQIPEDLTNNNDGVDDEIISAVLDWLKSIPVYPNFSADDRIKQKELAYNLAENLSFLKNQIDFISKAKNEIMSCVNDLPMWYPPYLNEKEQFINQIVADLLIRLDNVSEYELKHKVAQVISNLPYTENVETEEILNDFVNKIKTIVLHPPEDERVYMQALKPKIQDLLNKLPIQWTILKMPDLADKLANQLFRFSKSLGEKLPTEEEKILKEKIIKWCESVPELKDINFEHNKDLIDELANKFKFYKSRELNDENLQEELVKAIRIWLEKAGNSADLRLNSKIKNRLSDKMVKHFFGKDYNNSLNKRKPSPTSVSQEVSEPLRKWYNSIQELADGERTETKKALENLSNELNEIKSRDNNFENMLTDMKEVTTAWLQNILKKRSKRVDSKVFDNFVNKLISDLNVVPKRKKQRLSSEHGQFYGDIVSWIKDIPYINPESHRNETKVIETLVNKLNNIRKGSDMESTIIEAVTKFIKSLSESLHVNFHEEDIQTLKDKIFDRLQDTFKQRKRWDKINDLYKSILTEFSRILRAYSNVIDDTKLNNINDTFYQKFIEHVEKNNLPNWKSLIRQLNNIFLHDTNLPKHECENLANNIITKLQSMFPQEIARRSTILSQPVKAYAEPTRMMEHNLDETKKHRRQKNINDSESAFAKNKSKRRPHRKSNLQAGDGRQYRKLSNMSTIYKSSNSDLETHGGVEYYDNDYEINEVQNDHSAINNYKEFQTWTPLSATINNLPTVDVEPHDSAEHYDNNYELSGAQNDHLVINKHKEFQSSTPLSAAINNLPTVDIEPQDSAEHYDNNYELSGAQNDNLVINKHKEFQSSTPLSAASNNLSTVPDNKSLIGNVSNITQKELSKYSQFLFKLKNIVTDWIKSIDPNTNNLDLDNIVDGIASDIIDRQKYLQLSVTKSSENDELEHLKYQIFNKLNKLKKTNLLPQIMSNIDSLYRVIKNVSVPDLIKPVHESFILTTSVSHDSIFNKIKHWLDGVPSNLLKSGNITQNAVEIDKLVKNINNVKKDNVMYDYEIEKIILLWLLNVLKNCNYETFQKMAVDLKSYLQDTDLKSSDSLIKEPSELIDENIYEAITAWLQTAPFHKLCTFEERDLQKKKALLLTTNLSKILQATNNEADNLNEQLMEEVQKYLKTIPIPAEFRNNIYYYKAAGELLEYLKETITKIKEMCDSIDTISTTFPEINTKNNYLDYNDLAQNIIKKWCDSLPIHLGHSSKSKEQAKKLKHNIAIRLSEKLSDINKKEPNSDIDFEIMLSIEIDKIFHNVPMNRELERSLPVLTSILVEKLKQAKNLTQTIVSKKNLHDTLTKTLQEIENTPDLEQASLNLLKEKLADAFINLHYQSSTDDEFRDELKNKLYNEINNFCKAYLERYPYLPIDTDELRFNLYAILKKVPIPEMQHPDVGDESSKMSSEKEVASKNAKTKYSSPQFLSSTLSNEDRTHLETIRKRAESYAEIATSEKPDTNGSPQFKEVGVLTDCNEKVEENVQTSKTLLPETVSYNREIIPQVVIKEFYWDSNGWKQSLQMFVPPALTPHKIIPRKKETNNAQTQTEGNITNNSTKVNINQKFPETRKLCNNIVDKASDATSQDNHEKQEHIAKINLNLPVQESEYNQTPILPKDSRHRQQQTEKQFHKQHRKRDSYPDYDYGVRERYWIEQPRICDDDRCFRKDRQSACLEDSFNTPDDRRILTRRILLTPENRNKENMCCGQNPNTNWRMGQSACRRRCNALKYCSKCCGAYCPHPTMEFFKKPC